MTATGGPPFPPASTADPAALARHLLMISNGHGEDAIGARLAAGLKRTLPWLALEAFPLVGLGGAYQAAGVEVVGPRRELPSGGLTLHHQRLLLADLRAGLLPLTFAQLAYLRRVRPGAVLVVGDAFAQAQAQLVPAPRRVLQPLVSVHQAFELNGRPVARTALHRTFMERVRAPERWLMRRADKVYARDAATAAMLRASGVARAASLGNPVMDGLEAEPLAAVGPLAARLIVALLPGSRGYAARSLPLMASALLAAARRLPAEAGAGPDERPLLGVVAWSAEAIPATLPGWRVSQAKSAEVEQVWRWVPDSVPASEPDTVNDSEPGSGSGYGSPVELWFVRGRFAAVLASASVVIGTAGTANEQAAGRGLPVVAFAVPPDYGEAFLANQERLLGGAVRVVAAEPAAVAAAVLASGAGSAHRAAAAEVGPLRMGPPGGTAALVGDLAGWLQGLLLG